MENGIHEKIRKLLALARNNDNQAEAALALARAQALMMRHGIEEETLRPAGTPEEAPTLSADPLTPPGKSAVSWKVRLAGTLAKANGCALFLRSGAIHTVGRPSDIARLRALFTACEAETDYLAARRRTSGTGGSGKTWYNNYRFGVVDAISDAIRAERERTRADMRASASGSALMVLDNAIARIDARQGEAHAFMNSKLKLKHTAVSHYRGDAGARDAGRRDGAGVYGGASRTRIG
jgi:hypothetical protein